MSYGFSRGRTGRVGAPCRAWSIAVVVFAAAGCSDGSPPPDRPPVAHELALETAEDTPLEVQLRGEGEGALTITIVEGPEHGALSAIDADGNLTYTPDADYHGSDALVFRVTNAQDLSAEATVAITITSVNDAPSITSVADRTLHVGRSSGELAFTIGDVETEAEELVVVATTSDPTLVPDDPAHLVLGGAGASRTLEVVPAEGARGSVLITLSVSDGSATTSTRFTVDVVAPARLYWMTAAGSMWRVDVDGENPIELRTGVSGSSSIAVDPRTRSVFYTRDSAVVRVDEDGGGPVDVIANGGFPSALAVDATNRHLYWSDFTGKRVMRSQLDGTYPEPVLENVDSPAALAFDLSRGHVYLITYNNTKIVRFDLDGTDLETVAEGLGGLGVGLAIDPVREKLYFATRNANLYVVGLDGTGGTALVTSETSVYGIALDLAIGRLYWTDWLGQTVRSGELDDGSDVRTVHSGSSRNLSLAWMPGE